MGNKDMVQKAALTEEFKKLSNEEKADRDVVWYYVTKFGSLLEFASDDLKNDLQIVYSAIVHGSNNNSETALEFASNNLKNDMDLVLTATKYYDVAYIYASEELKDNRDFIRELSKIISWEKAISIASEGLRSDRDIVLEAVKNNGMSLRYASERLRLDRDVVLEAVKNNGKAIQHVSSAMLMVDKEVVGFAISQTKDAKQYLPMDVDTNQIKDLNIIKKVLKEIEEDEAYLKNLHDSLTSNKDFIFKLAEKLSWQKALSFASPNLKSEESFIKEIHANKSCVLEAIEKTAAALKFASNNLKNDKEVVLAAVRKNGKAIQYASAALRVDVEIIREAILQTKDAINYIPMELNGDTPRIKDEIVIQKFIRKVRDNKSLLGNAHPSLKRNKDFIIKLKEETSWKLALEYASSRLKSDWTFMLDSIREEASNLKYADEHLQADKEFVEKSIEANADAFRYAYNFYSNKEVVIKALKRTGSLLEYVSEELQKDENIILLAMEHWSEHNGIISLEVENPFDFIPEQFCLDKKIVLAAIKHHLDYYSTINSIPEDFRLDKDVILTILKYWFLGGMNPFNFIPKNFHSDKIVKQAVKEFFLKEIKNDDFEYGGEPFCYIPEDFLTDKDIILTAINKGEWNYWEWNPFNFIPKDFWSDKDVVLAAIKVWDWEQEDGPFNYISKNLCADKDVVIAVLSYWKWNYSEFNPRDFIPADLRLDKDIKKIIECRLIESIMENQT